MNLSKFMRRHNLEPSDVIAILQPLYPRFSKSQLSMAIHSDTYGISLTPKAVRLLNSTYKNRERN